ncbi:MAG: DUF1127 domain-containing protein [Natronospirillum sp.]|uniref:DUF1127 domain-containing protein n=1 Tax=Natronospirillum sp. TaxID=2812955 RepID=UPI0025D2A716|nr:DUF1127 domain-containing protein [Natronospirillum sp.]MCH8551206.1 DUF1127 domain-containing protein [Natronospirillum sp.]
MTAQVPNTPVVHPIRITLPLAAIKRLATRIVERMIERKSKRMLMEMPEYLLRDIGVTRYDIAQDLNRPFWR